MTALSHSFTLSLYQSGIRSGEESHTQSAKEGQTEKKGEENKSKKATRGIQK